LAAVSALAWIGPRLADDEALALEARLRSALAARDRTEFEGTLRSALRSHPSEPVFAVLASAERVARNDPTSGRWLNRAMSLAPGWQAPHVLAFEWLWRNGRLQQAVLELRIAARIDPQPVAAHICTVTRAGMQHLLAAAQAGPKRAHVLELGAVCFPPEHPTSQAIDDLLVREGQASPAVHQRRAFRLARSGRVDEALAELDLIQRRYPHHHLIWYVRSQLLLEAGRFREAAEVAATGLRRVPPEHEEALLTVRSHALARLGRDAELGATLQALRTHLADRPHRLAEVYGLEGDLAYGRKRFGEALHAYRVAYDISNDSKYLKGLAAAADEAGDRASARWANSRLCSLHPGDATACLPK
jgi:tetratricopeptide (TPR) repeat protein